MQNKNLESLWRAQDEMALWAEEMIAKQPRLSDQVDLIHEYLEVVQVVRQTGLEGKRRIALGSLFLRTFDDFANSLRAAMSGNYRGSAMYIRDLVETDFLLDYLMDAEGRPEEWVDATEDQLRDKYSAKVVRKALDKRDGFTEGKRAQRFWMLSNLGSHPTPNDILSRDGANLLRCGPFKQEKFLKGCIEEMALVALPLSTRLMRFSREVFGKPTGVTTPLGLLRQKVHAEGFGRISD